MTNLYIRESDGTYSAASHKAIVAQAAQSIRATVRKGTLFTSPNTAADYFLCSLSGEKREVFSVAFLDTRHRLITTENLFYGTIDAASVWPRQIARYALEHNAAAIVLAHNHPSGIAEPSAADSNMTKRIIGAMALLDIRVLDHIIVGDGTYSFAEHGIL